MVMRACLHSLLHRGRLLLLPLSHIATLEQEDKTLFLMVLHSLISLHILVAALQDGSILIE